jgi:hypothetical protein
MTELSECLEVVKEETLYLNFETFCNCLHLDCSYISVLLLVYLQYCKAVLVFVSPNKVFNPLKTKRICFLEELSAYRAVNTLHFGYKNQSLNVL